MGFNLLEDLPVEITLTILMMLPVESLICLMCVSRLWRNMISSGEFIQKYFQKSISGGNRFILCGPKVMCFSGKPCKFLSYTDPCISYKEGISCKLDSNGCLQIGSSGGLVCLADLHQYGTTIHLWNPFIRKSKSIHSSSININQCLEKSALLALGFGYIPEINEHKIVRIAFMEVDDEYAGMTSVNELFGFHDDYVDCFKANNVDYATSTSTDNVQNHNPTQVEVYSLSTDTWKRIEVPSFPWIMCDYLSRVLVNNCLHWLAFPKKINDYESLVLSFHLVNEVFQQITLPKFDLDSAKYVEIIDYKGSLSVLVVHPFFGQEFGSFWVMNDYGSPESWNNMFNITINGIFHWPSIISTNDEIIVRGGDGMNEAYLYDFRNQKIRAFNNEIGFEEFDFLPIVSSLTLLDVKSESMEGRQNQEQEIKEAKSS